MLVPLAEIEMAPIIAQVGSGEIRTRDSLRAKSARRNVATQIAIVVGSFADRKTNRVPGEVAAQGIPGGSTSFRTDQVATSIA